MVVDSISVPCRSFYEKSELTKLCACFLRCYSSSSSRHCEVCTKEPTSTGNLSTPPNNTSLINPYSSIPPHPETFLAVDGVAKARRTVEVLFLSVVLRIY